MQQQFMAISCENAVRSDKKTIESCKNVKTKKHHKTILQLLKMLQNSKQMIGNKEQDSYQACQNVYDEYLLIYQP